MDINSWTCDIRQPPEGCVYVSQTAINDDCTQTCVICGKKTPMNYRGEHPGPLTTYDLTIVSPDKFDVGAVKLRTLHESLPDLKAVVHARDFSSINGVWTYRLSASQFTTNRPHGTTKGTGQ